MFYTEKERQDFFDKDPIKFAARAHDFLCCDIPTLRACLNCKNTDCFNYQEINKEAKK